MIRTISTTLPRWHLNSGRRDKIVRLQTVKEPGKTQKKDEIYTALLIFLRNANIRKEDPNWRNV